MQQDGLISLATLEAAIRPQQTILVSIMAVNNETGVIQPLQQIGELVKKHRGVYFHTDAAQALGKIPLDVEKSNIDLMSLSGHKIYGPKGVGAAYVRRRPRVRLEPIMSGGGQERGLRSGTLPSTLVVGMGEACRLAKKEMEVSRARIQCLGTLCAEDTGMRTCTRTVYISSSPRVGCLRHPSAGCCIRPCDEIACRGTEGRPPHLSQFSQGIADTHSALVRPRTHLRPLPAPHPRRYFPLLTRLPQRFLGTGNQLPGLCKPLVCVH